MKEQRGISITVSDALIIVDVQRDFCPGGALPVPDGDQVIPVLNQYMQVFDHARAPIYATRDWHPPNHISFTMFGGSWPPHCIQDSEGAEFHFDLDLNSEVQIISKATTPDKEAYSGFDDTDLAESLKKNHTKRVFIGGLASDYCVKNTVVDALKYGYETFLLLDGSRGVNIQPHDSHNAIDEMIQQGALQITFSDLKHRKTVTEDVLEEKILERKAEKDKARTRTWGPYRKAWRSQGN
jgi:nicotinamidase/pyrazinamidase